jgi:branched-chain amino acid transport system substrate-binding protein
MICSQAGIPPQAASKKFLDGYKARFKIDPILYAPFTYDAMVALIESMKKANSADPAKYLPVLQKLEFAGATGRVSFDEKGDRKDPEMSIFSMKGGKLEPIAVIKGGKTMTYEEFTQQAGGGAPAPAAAPAAAEAPKAEEPAKK